MAGHHREDQMRLHLGAIEERLTKLTDAFLDGLVDPEMFQERKVLLLKDRVELRERLASAAEEQAIPDRVLKFFELAKKPKLGYEMANPLEKRDLVKTATSNLTANGKNVEIALQSPYREVLEWRKNGRCGHHPDRLRTFREAAEEILLSCVSRGLEQSPPHPQVPDTIDEL